jgi:hypothetical protein
VAEPYIKIKEKLAVDKNLWGKSLVGFVSKLSVEIRSETRVIGGYNCFKATTVRPLVKLILEISDLKEDPAAANR